MVVCESNINNIIGGIESTGGVTLHNHRRKLKQRFDIIKKLGQGTYGKVQLGINKETGQEVAIKTIKKCKIETEADLVRIRREIQIMSSVQHPNIIHIYEVFENREKMVLVMEYAAGGELYDYLSERKVLNEEEARRIFRQIVTAVYYCHKHKICHRDLKLENILLDEHGSAKIADFGLSNVFDERRLLSTFCGSPLYASPEIVKGTPYHGPEVDCWSLGVLLYTLVYGAMPFDGSNFKRLVKQISHGDYFEPKKPSPASPLIRDMLTVSPDDRANIEKICAHWWVNVDYKESCLEVAEELANQTPVRLDLLLSLAPPPPQVGSDKLVVTDEASTAGVPASEPTPVPTRSQSVGSLMELAPSAERRIRDLQQVSPKRKLEATVSTENANQSSTGAKRKERPVKKDKEPILDIPPPEPEKKPEPKEVKLTKCSTEPIKEMEIDPVMEGSKKDELLPEIEGAACKEIIEELSKLEAKHEEKPIEKIEEKKVVQEEIKEKVTEPTKVVEPDKPPEKEKKKVIKKIIKRVKVPSEKKLAEGDKKQEKIEDKKEVDKKPEEKKEIKKEEPKVELKVEPKPEPKKEPESPEEKNGEPIPPTKPIERRRSKIFETAEKLQNLAKGNEVAPKIVEKPRKILTGVSVGGFKKEFERKASLTSTAPLLKNTNSVKNINGVSNGSNIPNGSVPKVENVPVSNGEPVKEPIKPEPEVEAPKPTSPIKSVSLPKPMSPTLPNEPLPSPPPQFEDEEHKKRKQNAINIISSAISKEGARKSKSRPCVLRKTPIPFGASGRSASGNITTLPLSPTEMVTGVTNTISEESLDSQGLSRTPSDVNKRSTAEITLKCATLPPQRKTAKAEIKLNYPPPKPVAMEFKTEIAHKIEAPHEFEYEKTPVTMKFRSSSCDPDLKRDSPKERIIPICFEKEETKPDPLQSKPPMPKTHSMRSIQRHGSISRQSTQDSDSEVTVSESMEPIKKSPKEYIIPIAVEGGGYVTPRATSTEPSESGSGVSSMSRGSMFKFGRTKRMGSMLNDDESPGSTLHRHNSTSRDSDNEDSIKEPFHMHRLRSSRPARKVSLEHADSLSSAEEDDDDDGFEILTAENLFSTLLSRVRNLTQRLNVEDNGRLGFPSSRLLGDFDSRTKMFMNDPLSRYSLLDQTFNRERLNRNTRSPSAGSGTPWRRSVSRDLANDIDKVFNNTPTASATLPRGKSRERAEPNLSNEDNIALSYLTPGLSRRIRKHLLTSHIPSSHSSRSLSRKEENIQEEPKEEVKQPSLKNRIINRINRSISQDRGITNKYPKEKEQEFPDKTDFYYRSLSANEKTDKSNINDIITLNSLYNSRMPVRSISPIVTNKYPYTDLSKSRFTRSSFHEDLDRKNKEKETQKVLREIRKKRDSKEEKNGEIVENKIEKPDKSNEKLLDNKPEKSDKVEKVQEPKKSRISKLLRPKSYPTDCENDLNFNKTECNGIEKEKPQKTKIKTVNKPKLEKKSKVESTIRSLRERSLPHDTDYCATESNLIKRAVSLEDFSALSPPVSFKDKALQTSRKSVSKILGLFEKYETQSKNKQKVKKSEKSKDEEKKKKGSKEVKKIKNETNEVEQINSRIPKKFEKTPERQSMSPLEILKQQDELNKKSQREKISKMKLELNNEYKNDESIISPSDEATESVCSDSHYHDSSPNSHRIFSDDEECESVSERIHRKSFYSRFNEKKKKKKSSSAGAYDFKDYLAKFDEPDTSRKIKYDRSSSNRSFNSSYSSLRQPNYSRQSSVPADGTYNYGPYGDSYRSLKKRESFLPTSCKGSDGKDANGKTSKLPSQNSKNGDSNLENNEVQGSNSISRSSYMSSNF